MVVLIKWQMLNVSIINIHFEFEFRIDFSLEFYPKVDDNVVTRLLYRILEFCIDFDIEFYPKVDDDVVTWLLYRILCRIRP